MTDRLDEPLVTSSLKVLPHWTGDSTRISRSVLIAGTEAEQFLRALAESADAMNHHPEVEEGDGRLRISLSTHSAGGVTALDIAMASHIDDLVAQATGEPVERIHDAAPAPPEDDSHGRNVLRPPNRDDEEPLIGAASGGAGGPAVALPSDEPGQPEPGVAEEQERPTVE